MAYDKSTQGQVMARTYRPVYTSGSPVPEVLWFKTVITIQCFSGFVLTPAFQRNVLQGHFGTMILKSQHGSCPGIS